MELELFFCFGAVSCPQAVSCAPGACTEVSPSGDGSAGAEGLLDVEVTDVEDCIVEEAGVEETGLDDGAFVVSWLAPQAVRTKGNAMRMVGIHAAFGPLRCQRIWYPRASAA